MRCFKRTLLAAAITTAVAASGSAFAQFTGAYTFGDSLGDGGQFGYRFTTNPGLTGPEYVNLNWGIVTKPSFQGGTNWAEGGALVNSPQGGLPPGVPDLSVMAQVNAQIAKGGLNSNAIYTVEGGGNDIRRAFGVYAANPSDEARLKMQATVGQAAIDLATAAAKLKGAGAQYIVLYNVPDVGKVPDVTKLGPTVSGAFTSLSQLFNQTLDQAVTQAGLNVVRFDSFKFLNELSANPALYGLTNVTSPACSTPTGADCEPSNLVAPGANMTYLFADGLHGTTGTYMMQAAAVTSIIVAPMQMGALAEAPLAVEQANWRTLDGRMVSGINGPRSQGKFDAWAAYDYNTPDYASGFLAGVGNMNTVAVGGDMKVSDRVLAGVMFNYSENKANSGSLNYTLREPMLTFYAGYGDGPWYAAATLGAGSLDYGTSRNIQLGNATRTESGSTKGWHFVGRLIGGYWFKAGEWLHGPTIKLTFQEARVRQFEENGSDSTTMTFGQQERKSFITSAGWQASGQLGAVRPFGRVSWEYEGQSDARQVNASVYGMGGSFSMPTYKPDNNWALFNLGAATEFGKVTGYLTGSATAGKGDGDSWSITAGLRVPL